MKIKHNSYFIICNIILFFFFTSILWGCRKEKNELPVGKYLAVFTSENPQNSILGCYVEVTATTEYSIIINNYSLRKDEKQINGYFDVLCNIGHYYIDGKWSEVSNNTYSYIIRGNYTLSRQELNGTYNEAGTFTITSEF